MRGRGELGVRTRGYGICCMVITLLLPVLQAGASELEALRKQERRLERRVRQLEQEQELLLYRKSFQQSDSKYLIIDRSAGRGTLRYRGRVLRTFPVSGSRSARPGPAVMTARNGVVSKANWLVFGNDAVIRVRGTALPAGELKGVPVLTVGSRDMAVLSTVLDVGSQIYLQ